MKPSAESTSVPVSCIFKYIATLFARVCIMRVSTDQFEELNFAEELVESSYPREGKLKISARV